MTLPNASDLDPATIRVMCAEEMGTYDRWVIIKRGLYYRPNGNGYTSDINQAWIVPEEVANKHAYPHDEPVTVKRAPLPPYEASADAALALVEKMEAEGYKSQWHEHVWTFYKPLEAHAATALTLALAICRAFLKSRGLAQ